MSACLESVTWSDARPVLKIFDDASRRQVRWLVVSRPADTIPFERIEQITEKHASADVIAFVDRSRPARSARLTELFPAPIGFLIASPEEDLALAIRVEAIGLHREACQQSGSLREFIHRIAKTGHVVFVGERSATNVPEALPDLYAPTSRTQSAWLEELIQRFAVPSAGKVAMTALRAGLFLFCDLFDQSHSCSQSIEGEGRFHTGDYWHAILHRREPDYGNSKYWYRRVGSHPVLEELATAVSNSPQNRPGEIELRCRSRVIINGAWDPYAFVDLCEAAESDAQLKRWCEAVQYQEMLLLLEHSYLEAAGMESS